MLILECPYCGVCPPDETELAPGYEAHLKRFGPGASDEEFEILHVRPQEPQGRALSNAGAMPYGCGKWFLAARCTATLEVFGTYPAQVSEPPAEIIAKIKAKTARTGRASNEHRACKKGGRR